MPAVAKRLTTIDSISGSIGQYRDGDSISGQDRFGPVRVAQDLHRLVT